MSDLSLSGLGFEEVGRRMHAAGPACVEAVRGGVFAGAVYMAEAIWQASHEITGDMRFSTYVDMNGKEAVLGQVAPYTEYEDFRHFHFTGTYQREQSRALDVAAKMGNRLLVEGRGPEAVQSRFNREGVFRNSDGRF